jgi:tRNA(fMet)-specific endonuclease VapC
VAALVSLDTSICIAILRDRSDIARQRLQDSDPQEIAISVLVYLELRTGAEKARNRNLALERVETLVAPFEKLHFDANDVRSTAWVRSELEKAGRTIGAYDLLIAGQALARGLVVATNNVCEFSRVPGLKVEDWLAPTSA